MLSLQRFEQLAKDGFNRIPFVRKVLADFDTPLSTYLKLADQPYSYLLESVQGGEKWGRYSVIGLPCRERIQVTGNRVQIFRDDICVEDVEAAQPLDHVRRLQQRYRAPPLSALPRFTGGLVGYFGYDTIRFIEPGLGANAHADPLGAPDILLMVSEEIVVFDTLAGCLYVLVHIDPNRENAYQNGYLRLNELVNRLARGITPPRSAAGEEPVDEAEFVSSFPEEKFKAAVERCKQYIYDGDAFQIVISQRLSLPFHGQPLDLYRALRTLNPSPYMYFLNLRDFQIAGSSPEILVRLENGEVTVRPIAGTRRRGDNEEADRILADSLLNDPKELAEHLMLIDLGRNDVGRVAKIGSVKVTDKMAIEKYSHVMHIVSNVTGEIRDGLDAIDVLKATFPAGTLSGAPKVRAIQIIEELEPDKRGIYSGAIGYIGWNGNMDTAIAIRTALIKDQTIYIQAGAGIVADSVPQSEWQETMNKGRAVIRAVQMVNRGLHQPLNQGADSPWSS